MFIHSLGYIEYGGYRSSPLHNLAIYPTFYLDTKTYILNNGANGSKNNPYILLPEEE